MLGQHGATGRALLCGRGVRSAAVSAAVAAATVASSVATAIATSTAQTASGAPTKASSGLAESGGSPRGVSDDRRLS